MSQNNISPLNPVYDNSLKKSVVVLLIHGLNSSHQELVFLKSAIQKEGFNYELMEIDGYSYKASKPNQNATSFQFWIDSILKTADDLRLKHDLVFIAGISTGANLALAATLQNPKSFDGVVVMSLSLFLDGWKIPIYHFFLPILLYTPLGYFYKYRETSPFGIKDERIRSWVERELTTQSISAVGSIEIGISHLRENHRLQRWLMKTLQKHKSPDIPLLALHAQEDELTSTKNVFFLQQNWPIPFYESIIFINSYHMISIDHDRYKVNDAVVNFINKITQTS